MAVRISSVVQIDEASKGFRFENYKDSIEDRKQYEEGRILEQERFRQGSLAQRMFARLSSQNKSAKEEEDAA